MSTALKYRVDLTPTTLRKYQWIIPALTVWCILPALSANTYSWVSLGYFSLLACVASVIFYWHNQRKAPCFTESFLLGDDGSWQQTMLANHPIESNQEYLNNQCKVTPWAVFLCFTTPTESRWVIRGECDELSYRRLCRIVLQRTNTNRDN
ncbi:hypothetical protein OPS25_02540 [Alteromonas ponticola]|uniref:Toxin CptA n=1 Tax=Alteromonas aquimaris TaxID=2998417 RepID=A0ABT3P3M7_9ALTE|nr:protein YgfX [Alteromonas aquimaris]MCW8107379.1 hypothetical protein [Alteromonas aquimaris]